MGGLGNQMFQYAYGKSLASINGSRLLLDCGFYDSSSKNTNITPRTYSLDQFPNLKGDIITKKELSHFNNNLESQNNSFWGRLISQFNPYRILREKQFPFDVNNLNQRGNVYVEGYWQSEKYFISVRNNLLNEFAPKITNNESFELIKNHITETNSVSIHVRRGDYVSNKKSAAWHGILGVNYYMRGLDLLKQSYEDFKVFIFSDDSQWVKANLSLSVDTYLVSGRGLSEVEELILMSTCKHQIIANSSFSWWGAWLNTYSGKNVIAPKRWFANQEIDSSDIYAENWIKI